MTNEDYRLEELENAAVKKSSNAKRIAAAAGLLATGGAAGYAATNIPLDSNEEGEEGLSVDDLESVTDAGASQVTEPQPAPQSQPAQPEPQPVAPVEEPQVEEEPEVEVDFEKTTHFYDQNNELFLTTEEGTIDGHKFILGDVDGDMRADYLAYDMDNNGVINDDEVFELTEGNKIAMGNATRQHEDQFLAVNYGPEQEPVPYVEPLDIEKEKDMADNTVIHNDFEDEKTGESYSHDYAENNRDYNNNGDVEQYSAGTSDYAYDGEEKEYNDIAENDMNDDTFDDLGNDTLDMV